MPQRPASLKVRALQWLAQREHSRKELRDKLLRLLQSRSNSDAAAAMPSREAAALEACRAWGVDSENRPQQGQFLPDMQPHSPAMGQKDGEKWTAAGDSQPTLPKSDRLLEVETLLQWLEARGYLNDARFVEVRLRARQSRFGNLRIQHELRQHGVTLDADSHQALQQSEFERARALWSRRYAAPPVDARARLRQMRFLAARGFSLAVVRRVVGPSGATTDHPSTEEPPIDEP